MNIRQLAKNRLFIFVAVGILIVAVLGVLIAVIASVTAPKNPYGASTDIPGYDTEIKNLSAAYKDTITSQLYQTIKLNNPNGPDPTKIKDIVIRTSSVKQQVITSQKEYSGSFIIDIASINQSYKVQYVYSTDPNDPVLSGYPITISCPDKSELVYGDFNCKTTYDQSQTQQTDPIVAILPYSTLDYEIAAVLNSDGYTVASLEVHFSLSDTDYRAGADQVVAARKQEVLAWIKSNGIDPSKYVINYSY